jgi:hypothetical protein
VVSAKTAMATVETAMDLGITANLMGISATVCESEVTVEPVPSGGKRFGSKGSSAPEESGFFPGLRFVTREHGPRNLWTYHTVLRSGLARILSSWVINVSPSARAVPPMMRSAGSCEKSAGKSAPRAQISGVIGRTATPSRNI